MSIDQSPPTIPEFFNGQTVLLTGGSGFIGKVLIEKLLRTCPDIRTIYLLMRPKRNKTVEQRIREITDLALFDRLKEECIESLKKIKLIEGDVTKLQLGVSEEDRNLLIQEVTIIYHAAASVRFDDPLSDAIIMNTRGTREMCLLAHEMRNLQCFIYISTTYCNTNRRVIEEKLYPALADWRQTIKLAENVDRPTLDVLTAKYMGPLPNTYTFSKSLAEHVVVDLCTGRIPLIIFRPSIVISSVREPVPGWVDNFNGPVGIMVASGKGINRSVFSDPTIVADYVPVDIIVNGLLIAAWDKVITSDKIEKMKPSFYNGSNNNFQPVTAQDIVQLGKTICWELPLNDIIWYPNGNVTKCRYYHYLKVIFYHLLPALIIDGLLKIAGHKPMLTKVQRRIYTANMALEYFLVNEWQFVNDNARKLEDKLLASDYEVFSYHKDEIDVLQYFKNATLGIRRYLMKEHDSTMEQAKVHMKRMWVLSLIFNIIWYVVLLWIIFFKFEIMDLIVEKFNDICVYFTSE